MLSIVRDGGYYHKLHVLVVTSLVVNMLLGFHLLYCLSFLFKVQGSVYKENITDFSKCKSHVTDYNGKYTVFYKIDQTAANQNDSLVFDFHFAVLARSDAHILLAEDDVVLATDPVYEILIGGGTNTFSQIRLLLKASVKSTSWRHGLLSAIEFRSFWIHVWNDGLLEVGQEGQETPFLKWKDPKPLKFKYFSFGTWPKVEAKWYFNCERDHNKISEVQLNDRQRLILDLFQNYDVLSRPVLFDSVFTNVDLQLILQYIYLDENTSQLQIHATGYMKWIDEKLIWDSNSYGGIKSLKLQNTIIWTPDLRLYENQVNLSDVIVFQNGFTFCNIILDASYWCNIDDVSTWPSDIHKCILNFVFVNDGDKIKPNFTTQNFFSNFLSSEWTVNNVEIEYTGQQEIFFYDDNQSGVNMILTIQRMSNIYKLIYISLFFAITISALITFCVSPIGYLKITLCCLQLIMESIVLIHISNKIPIHPSKIPTLVMLYSGSLISTMILVIISTIVINLSRNQHHSIPNILYSILSSKVLQRILFLSTLEKEGDFGILSNNYRRSTEEDTIQSVWIQLGKVIDRISFVIYFILSIIAVSQT